MKTNWSSKDIKNSISLANYEVTTWFQDPVTSLTQADGSIKYCKVPTTTTKSNEASSKAYGHSSQHLRTVVIFFFSQFISCLQ